MVTLPRPQGPLSRRAVLGVAAAGATLAPLVYSAPAVAARRGMVESRKGWSFDEGWRFHRGALKGAQARDFRDAGWRRLDLPHDMSIEDLPGGSDDGGATADPSFHLFLDSERTESAPRRIGPFDADSPGGHDTGYTLGGEGWYRKHFRLDDLRPGQRVELRLDGVQQVADVWINGHHLGFQPYGYSIHHYDLTPHLRRGGDNVVAVRARNIGLNSRWYAGTGIYRHTWLTVTEPVHVPLFGVRIETPQVSAERAVVAVGVSVRNESARPEDVRVECAVLDPQGRVVGRGRSARRPVEKGRSRDLRLTVPVRDPRRWSPETPHLYRLRTDVIVDGRRVDRVVERFGIRTVEMDENGFRLNGRTYEMRGVNVHHDHGPLGAKAFDRSEERRVRILKDAGYNAIRTAHNPFPPAFLEACDRLGMFVYDEFVDMWDQGKRANDYSVHFAKNWRKDVRRWLAADRNHPSVVLWSIGNELGASGAPIPQPGADADARAARGKQVADLVRSIDPTRPVVEGGGQGIWFFAAANPMPEWPADAYTDVGDVHYIHDYGLRPQGNPGKAYLQSESFPATAYDDWKMVTDHPYAVGDFVWTGWDYLGETGLGISEVVPFRSGPPLSSTDDPSGILQVGGIIGPYPYYGAACGDFDLIGQPKPQLRYRQVVWGDSPLELQVERPVGEGLEQRAMCWGWFDELESWTWDVPQGRPMRVHAYTTGDLVTLLLDGVPVGTVPVTPADKCVASFDVPYVPGTLTAVAYRLGEEIGRKELTTVGEPARLRLRSEEGRLPRRRDALGHVLVEVLDAQGRLVPDAVRKVRFDVRGGDLVAVGNGNSHNVDSFTRPRRHTYHGVAMVYVRPRKGSDTITVRAESSGLRPAVTRIPVRG